ncbi:MAG TPA: ATP-binding protein [Burkholderiaceae bacterium]
MLDFASLTHYDWLDTPMWVLDAKGERRLWANAAGLSFWRAESLDAFLRAELAPPDEATRQRYAAMAAGHAQDRSLREQWTLQVAGAACSVLLASRGVLLNDGSQAMLLAAQALPEGADRSSLRGVEALQHTATRIALFSLNEDSALYLNAAAQQAFSVADAGTLQLARLFASPDLAALVRRHVRSGQVFTGEVELNTADGLRWHSVDARPLRDPVSGAAVLQFNANDISDFRLAQAALTRAREVAVLADQAKSNFLASMSHEIRTPMNSLLGLTELVLQSGLPEREHRFIELAHDAAKSLMGLINDLMDVAQIEAGRVLIRREPFSLHDCLQATLQPLQVTAAEKGIRLRALVQPGVPAHLLGDALRMRQILMNLVGNSLKFTERGEVRIEVHRLDLARGAAGETVHLAFSVHDTGMGLTREQIVSIFDPASQADAGRRYSVGPGLGLTIVQRLVGMMGGRVSVESEPNLGSCFSFEVTMGRPSNEKHA